MIPILYSREQAIKELRIGEKAFNSLNIPYIPVGKRKKYRMEDIQNKLDQLKREATCPSKSAKAPRTTHTTLRSMVIGFEEALRQTTSQLQKQ